LTRYFTDNYRFRNDIFGPIDEDVLIHVDTRTGETKSRWGAKLFYLPHGLTIDHHGNIWLTDVAMHQVFMFKANNLTHPALSVGTAFQAGSGSNHFCRPADIAVMKNGDFFVADG
jgi:peptidylamidoglycolate lyase